MTVSSPSELIEALVAGKPERLSDTRECEWLDFKEKPYNLVDDRQKWELVKDVASLANAGGGYIVIGVRTEKHPSEPVESAAAVEPVHKDTIDVDAYRKVVRSAIYPSVPEMTYKFYPDAKETEEAVFVVEIISQSQHDKPFILRRAFAESVAVKGAVAIPQRDGDQTEWWSAEKIHELIGRGRQLQSTMQRNPSQQSAQALLDRVSELEDEAELMQDWEESPIYSLAAVPSERLDLVPKFYGDGGLVHLLGHPSSLREAGFNLDIADRLEVLETGAVGRLPHKFVRLELDGILIAVVAGDRDFLQWGINEKVSPSTNRINTLALVEVTYEFFRLFETLLRPAAEAQSWTFVLDARRFRSAGVVLDAGLVKRGFGSYPPKPAASDAWRHPWNDLGSPESNATQALTYFYALFGRGQEDFAVFVDNNAVSAQRILEAANNMR